MLGTIDSSILSTFDDIWRSTKGNLPHVRTELDKYLNEKGPRINNLSLSSIYKLENNIYGRFNFGYLEPMYAGISSEILLLPSENNLGAGLELNYVKARDFDQKFGLRKLNGLSKINGHVSGYWDTNFYNYLPRLIWVSILLEIKVQLLLSQEILKMDGK